MSSNQPLFYVQITSSAFPWKVHTTVLGVSSEIDVGVRVSG